MPRNLMTPQHAAVGATDFHNGKFLLELCGTEDPRSNGVSSTIEGERARLAKGSGAAGPGLPELDPIGPAEFDDAHVVAKHSGDDDVACRIHCDGERVATVDPSDPVRYTGVLVDLDHGETPAIGGVLLRRGSREDGVPGGVDGSRARHFRPGNAADRVIPPDRGSVLALQLHRKDIIVDPAGGEDVPPDGDRESLIERASVAPLGEL